MNNWIKAFFIFLLVSDLFATGDYAIDGDIAKTVACGLACIVWSIFIVHFNRIERE